MAGVSNRICGGGGGGGGDGGLLYGSRSNQPVVIMSQPIMISEMVFFVEVGTYC